MRSASSILKMLSFSSLASALVIVTPVSYSSTTVPYCNIGILYQETTFLMAYSSDSSENWLITMDRMFLVLTPLRQLSSLC